MKKFTLVLGLMASMLAATLNIHAQEPTAHQEIIRNGTQATTPVNPQVFTGSAWVDSPFAHGSMHGAYVTFAPEARTAWHIHPRGQLLLVTQGSGLTQEEGGPIQIIRAGDMVWCPPGVKHWHGGGYTTSMTHLAVSESLPGETVTWLDKVSDKEYHGTKK